MCVCVSHTPHIEWNSTIWRFPKLVISQIIPNSTILVLKPMVLGIPHSKTPRASCHQPEPIPWSGA